MVIVVPMVSDGHRLKHVEAPAAFITLGISTLLTVLPLNYGMIGGNTGIYSCWILDNEYGGEAQNNYFYYPLLGVVLLSGALSLRTIFWLRAVSDVMRHSQNTDAVQSLQ